MNMSNVHPDTKAGRSLTRMLTLLLATIALVATACGADSITQASSEASFDRGIVDAASDAMDTAGDDSAPAAEPVVVSGGESAAKASDTLGSGGVEPAGVQPVIDIGRDIIYTATTEVAVLDVAAAGREASQIISAMGGLLFGQSSTTNPSPRTVLTFKVRPEDFQQALSQLGGIGDLRNQTVSADDVTERVVDLESRISTSAASVERLRNLLDGANDVEVIAQLERQLLDRETTLETLRGQLRTVQDRVDLATITLTIVESLSRPEIMVATTVYPGHDAGTSCAGNRSLQVETGEDVTWCFNITNVGDAPLTRIAVTDPAIGLTSIDETTITWGDLTVALQPGESIVAAWDSTGDETVSARTRVSGQPIDDEGQLLGAQISSTDTIRLTTFDPDVPPGFGDALRASWKLLGDLGRFLLLAAGALLPFIWVVPLVWFGRRWLRDRKAQKQADARTATSTHGPDDAANSEHPPPPTAPKETPSAAPVPSDGGTS